MIVFLSGVIRAKTTEYLDLEVASVGYRIFASSRTLKSLGGLGQDALIFTHLHLRENEVTLFGFSETFERDVFLKLIDVSGVGPKVALSALSALSAQMLVNGIASEDIALLSSVPGIGKKTASRIILDLRDSLLPLQNFNTFISGAIPQESDSTTEGIHTDFSDARAALLAMGFSPEEAAEAVGEAPAGLDAAKIVSFALKQLSGRSGRGQL